MKEQNKMTKQQQLNEMVKSYYKLIEQEEEVLIQFALENNLDLYLGEYGETGRRLVHDWNEEAGYPVGANGEKIYTYSSPRYRGEWVYSYETC